MAAAAGTRALAVEMSRTLKAAFPSGAARFRVTAGGPRLSSGIVRDYLDIAWTDGPALATVRDLATGVAAGAGFDPWRVRCRRSYSAAFLRRAARVWAHGFGCEEPVIVEPRRGAPYPQMPDPHGAHFWDVAAALDALHQSPARACWH